VVTSGLVQARARGVCASTHGSGQSSVTGCGVSSSCVPLSGHVADSPILGRDGMAIPDMPRNTIMTDSGNGSARRYGDVSACRLGPPRNVFPCSTSNLVSNSPPQPPPPLHCMHSSLGNRVIGNKGMAGGNQLDARAQAHPGAVGSEDGRSSKSILRFSFQGERKTGHALAGKVGRLSTNLVHHEVGVMPTRHANGNTGDGLVIGKVIGSTPALVSDSGGSNKCNNNTPSTLRGDKGGPIKVNGNMYLGPSSNSGKVFPCSVSAGSGKFSDTSSVGSMGNDSCGYSSDDIPSVDTLAYSMYSNGYRPHRPSSGIMGMPYDSYYIDPYCKVCGEALHLYKSGCSSGVRQPIPNRLLVDSCCTLSFIPRRLIPTDQECKIYTPLNATRYVTGGNTVECSEAIDNLRIIVNTECGSKLALYVSGMIAPPNSNAPFLLSGSVVDSLHMSKDKDSVGKVKVVIDGYSIVSYLVKGMPAIDFSFHNSELVDPVPVVDHFMLYNNTDMVARDNTIREYHKCLGHILIGPDALRLCNGIVFPVQAIKDVVGPCHLCQRFKGNPKPTKNLITERSDIKDIDYSKLVFNKDISVDLKPIGNKGFYLFVIMCDNTRFIAIKWIKDKSPGTVLDVFRKIWSDKHGDPNGSLLYDGGNEWNKLVVYLEGLHNGIQMRKTAKDTGFSNPRNERSHGPIMVMLKSALKELDIPPIAKVVKPISEVYIPSVLNNTVKRVLGGKSPIELAKGIAPVIPEYYPGEKVRFIGKPNTAIRPTMSDRWTVGKYVSHSEFGEIMVIYNSDKASDKMEVIHASRVKKWRSSVEDSRVNEFNVIVPKHKIIEDSGIDPTQSVEYGIVPMGSKGTGTGINLCSGTGRDASIMSEYFSQVVSLDCECEAADLAISKGDRMASKPDIISSILTWDYHKWYSKWLSKGNSVVTCVLATPPCNIFTLIRTLPGRRPPSKAEWVLACDIILKIRQIHKFFSEYLGNRCKLGVSLFIENPSTGRIRECGYVDDLRQVVTSWCKVGSTLRKDTVFFTNVSYKYFNLPLPCAFDKCELVCSGKEHDSCLKAKSYRLYCLPPVFVHGMCSAVVSLISDTDMSSSAPVVPDTQSGPSSSSTPPPSPKSMDKGKSKIKSRDRSEVQSGSESEPDLYEIDDIVGKRGKGPKTRYKVQWSGGECTWVPIQRLRRFPDAMQLVRQYDSAVGECAHLCESEDSDIVSVFLVCYIRV